MFRKNNFPAIDPLQFTMAYWSNFEQIQREFLARLKPSPIPNLFSIFSTPKFNFLIKVPIIR
jgi:hypothetical protein